MYISLNVHFFECTFLHPVNASPWCPVTLMYGSVSHNPNNPNNPSVDMEHCSSAVCMA